MIKTTSLRGDGTWILRLRGLLPTLTVVSNKFSLLFQTLNTTHKRFRMPNGQMGLMLDTVGFITNLPHGLVESFKATLEEIHYVDLLVHVRDISHP